MLESALDALVILASPDRLGMMLVGVCVGLVVGILPGIGGTVGMALLIPFVYGMDIYSGVALLIGMVAVNNTADTFTAVLMGVPGSGGAQATMMDGYPMAKRGEAGRALGASFISSMLGGLIGAVMLLVSIPIARPLVLSLGTPELFMLTLVGLTMVGVLSRGRPLIGILAGLVGLIVGAVGGAPGAPVYRYTFDILYLSQGIPLVVVALGLFAIPEIVTLLASGRRISATTALITRQWDGVKDVWRNKWLVVRCSLLASFVGLVPGLGGGVVDWLAYGFGKATSKGGQESFGTGDVRGVIAPEAANNCKDGAELVPTLMFGIPTGGSMAVFLGGLMLLGVQTGPAMVDPSRHLSLTLVIVWTLVLANVVGTALCFGLSRYMARLSLVPPAKFIPFLLIVVVIAAYQSSRHWGDIIALVIVGTIGCVMKQLSWPRVPFLIGFILAVPTERYLTVATSRYGADWLTRPLVLVIGTLIIGIVVWQVVSEIKAARHKRQRQKVDNGQPAPVHN